MLVCACVTPVSLTQPTAASLVVDCNMVSIIHALMVLFLHSLLPERLNDPQGKGYVTCSTP